MLKTLSFIAAAVVLGAGCAQTPVSASPPDNSSPSGSAQAGTQEGDWAVIVKLEDQAKAIAKVTGCATGECRSAPVGSRACGGPRYYIPYCSKTTDSVSLFRKLDEVGAAEKAYNIKYKIASTCDFRMPPTVDLVGGSCTAR